eukprot:2721717-Prymnesium_polylepis.1
MIDEKFECFMGMLDDLRCPPSVKNLKASTTTTAKARRKMKSNENKHYVNFAEGTDPESLRAAAEIVALYDLSDFFVLTPGPFIRSTRGVLVTPMPMTEGSTYN